MSVDSNIDEVAGALNDLVKSINFALPGDNQSLGRDLVGVVAEGIADRSVPGAKAPDGSDWRENERKYAAYKAKRYSAYQPGILSGQMLSLASLKGEPVIGPDSIEMRYGLGVPPGGRSSTGAALPPSYNATDREKAEHFSKDRPFYEMDNAIAERCVKACEAAIARMLG